MSLVDVTTPRLPSPVAELQDDRLWRAGVRLWLKRDDLVHSDIPGNKWRKLAPNLTAATHRRILTFGGAFSNHIRAVAAAGRLLGFDTIGVIRGEPHTPLNWSLQRATRDGMTLTYLDRSSYRDKYGADLQQRLGDQFGEFYLIPEGGSNVAGVSGSQQLAAELNGQLDVDTICVPCGSGGTLAGVAAGLSKRQQGLGFGVLRPGDFLNATVEDLQRKAYGQRQGNWRVISEFHHGGFARRDSTLDDFITDFAQRHGIALDWIYVAKMMHGLFRLVERGEFSIGSRIAAVITGPAEADSTCTN